MHTARKSRGGLVGAALATAALLASFACGEPKAPEAGAAQCSVVGTWRLKVLWNEGKCDIVGEGGEGMRVWINRGSDGSLDVSKGSKLGDSNVEATAVEADPKDCSFVLTASSETREENPATVVFRMKQTGDKASGVATLDRKVAPEAAGRDGACRQTGTVEATKL